MTRVRTDRCRGFTLVEVLVATALLVIFLVPGMQALDTVTRIGTESGLQMQRSQLLDDKMSTVLAHSFPQLAAAAAPPDSATVYSDPVSANPRVIVYISKFDGDATGNDDPFTPAGVDPDLLWIRVAIDGNEDDLVTLVYR